LSQRTLFHALAGVAGVTLFAQSLRMLGVERILEGVGRVGWGFAGILLLSGAREAVRAFAWMRTVEGPVPLRFLPAFRARLVGEALNTLLPMGMVVGEPAKASHVAADIPFAAAFSALAVEFAFYCGSLVLLLGAGLSALAVLNKVPLDFHLKPFGLISAALIGALAIGLTSVRLGTRRAAGVEDRDGRVAIAVTRGINGARRLVDVVFGFAFRHPEHLRAIIACEIAYQVCAVAEVYVTLLLVSPLPPTLASAVVLETVSRVITMLFKMVPMRVGVDEVSSSLFAGRLDLGASTGLTLALVRKLRLLVWSAIGLALLAQRRTVATAEPAHA
jgi:hypothetical protein